MSIFLSPTDDEFKMEFWKFAWHEVCHDSSRQLAKNSPKSITVRSKQMGNELMALNVKKNTTYVNFRLC
jgi:hypothetical protein